MQRPVYQGKQNTLAEELAAFENESAEASRKDSIPPFNKVAGFAIQRGFRDTFWPISYSQRARGPPCT